MADNMVEIEVAGEKVTVQRGQDSVTLPSGRKANLTWGETMPETFLGAQVVIPVTVLYSPPRKFNGQALCMGRVIIGYSTLSEHVEGPEPFTVRCFYADKFRTTDGHAFWYKDFVADPSTARSDDGVVMLHLEPGQWCFQPRV